MSRAARRRPAASRARRLLLWCAATDRSFERADLGGIAVLTGKCIHCGARHVLELDGRPRTRASVEHIIPRHHGGTDAIANLAIACERCNYGKGTRLDGRRLDDPTLQRVIAMLQARRAERMRPPLPGLDLPPLGERDDDPDEPG
jgi:5-methylcytosine-specific restriction endonuclease McrA